MENLLEKIVALAKEAGKIILNAQNIQDGVKEKEGYANYVTKYDSLVQKFVFEKLHDILPNAKFMGEEDEAAQFSEDYKNGFCFVVDPIDGTLNFINNYRISVVSIALLRDGVATLGVVYNPYSDEVFYAEKGKGAFCNGKRIFSSNRPIKESLVLMGTAPYTPEYRKQTFETAMYYFDRCADLRRSGAAAWDLCCVASGRAALFFEYSLCVWDYAAGFVILDEALGKVTDILGGELTFDKKTSCLAVCQSLVGTDYLPH